MVSWSAQSEGDQLPSLDDWARQRSWRYRGPPCGGLFFVGVVREAPRDPGEKLLVRPSLDRIRTRHVLFEALRVKIRDEGAVRDKAAYLAVAPPEGRKDVLGIWIEQTDGAKFRVRVMTEPKNRSVGDILIAVTPVPTR